jgi:hypothetical protein
MRRVTGVEQHAPGFLYIIELEDNTLYTWPGDAYTVRLEGEGAEPPFGCL